MNLDELPRLVEFLVRCIDEESLGGLKLRRDQAGAKFIAPWSESEPLLGPNAPSLKLTPGATYEREFLDGASRIYYGYPLFFQRDGHLSPLFFIQADIQKQEHDSYNLFPVLKSLNVNRLVLKEAGLSQEEADLLSIELEGDFGSFEARLKTAVDALDLPQRLFEQGSMDELPRHTDQDVWCKLPLLFLSSVSTAKNGLRFELSRFTEKDGYIHGRVSETALGALLAPEAAGKWAGGPQNQRFEVSPLNAQQAEAVDKALTSPLTVITGPPGTGKSQVVVNILANCVASGQSVLIASNNNKPLDEVRQRVAEIMKDVGDFTLRLGNREIRQTAKDSMAEKLGRLVEFDGESSMSEIYRRLELLSIERKKCQQELRDIQEAQSEIERALEEERQASSVLPENWIRAVEGTDLTPVDYAALRSISLKVDRWTGRAPRGALFTLRKLLMGSQLLEDIEVKLRNLYAVLPRGIQELSFPSAGRSSVEGLCLATLRLEQHLNWKTALERRHEAEKRLATFRPVEAIGQDLKQVNEKRVSVGRELFRADWSERLSSNSGQAKDAVERYFDHVERLGQKGKKNREFFKGYEQSVRSVMKGLPVWMITNLSVGTSLPLQPSLFDCVVIDEASQSDFASILPLLFRAKRAVLVGDPKQLSHIPGVTPKQEQYIAHVTDTSDLLVNFSPITRSAYDLGASAVSEREEKEILLSQHYRCHPEIIGFSNMAFYDQRLVARTAGNFEPSDPNAGLQWHHVVGELSPTKKSAANIAEVKAAVDLIGKIISRSDGKSDSIGVVTPFRLQTDHIREAIKKQSWWEENKSRIIVGTAHTFQGSECDVMIFSPVVTKGLRDSLVQFAAHSDELLNVAVTRAKTELHVIGDREGCHEAGGGLAKLVEYTENIGSHTQRRPTPPSEAEVVFSEILKELGLSYQEEVPVFRQPDQAPYRLDFLYISDSGERYDLEVDGGTHHENERFQEDAIRNKFVEASGYKVIRFPARDVLNDREAVRERLRRLA